MPRATLDPCPDAPRPFGGPLLELSRPRRCAVCGQAMQPGAQVISHHPYVAHTHCGIWDGFSKRRGSL
jgi:hypothetical protein